MLADKILGTVSRKTGTIVGNPDGKIARDALQLVSMRVGSEPGTHTITIDSPEDTIVLEHRARSRAGFAKGAVRAARWIMGKQPGIYTMDDFISDLLEG